MWVNVYLATEYGNQIMTSIQGPYPTRREAEENIDITAEDYETWPLVEP